MERCPQDGDGRGEPVLDDESEGEGGGEETGLAASYCSSGSSREDTASLERNFVMYRTSQSGDVVSMLMVLKASVRVRWRRGQWSRR